MRPDPAALSRIPIAARRIFSATREGTLFLDPRGASALSKVSGYAEMRHPSRYPHCVAKIKMNGNCQGFENFDSCYAGRCWWGRCIPVGSKGFTLTIGRPHIQCFQGNRAWAAKILKDVEAMNSTLNFGFAMTDSDDNREVGAKIRLVKMTAPLFRNCFNR